MILSKIYKEENENGIVVTITNFVIAFIEVFIIQKRDSTPHGPSDLKRQS